MHEAVETPDISKAEMTPHMAEGIRLALEAMRRIMEFIAVNDDRIDCGGTFVEQDVNEFLSLTYSKCARAYQTLSEDINIQATRSRFTCSHCGNDCSGLCDAPLDSRYDA